jgi:hypothetical protein
MNMAVKKYLSTIGKKGGSVTSEAKTAASRANGKRGGRPISEQVDTYGMPLEEDMASYDSRDTGLPFNVLILSRGGAKHGPRVKFQQDYGQRMNADNVTSLTISDEPRVVRGHSWKLSPSDFKLAVKFIKLNKVVLLKYWRNEIMTRELENSLKKV